MRLEVRRRYEEKKNEDDLQLSHIYLVIIFEKHESEIIDQFGQPGTKFVGEVRLSDGYGEHYLLIQPTHIELGHGDTRDIPQEN